MTIKEIRQISGLTKAINMYLDDMEKKLKTSKQS